MGPLCCPCLLIAPWKPLPLEMAVTINLVACGEDVCLNLLRQSVAFRILKLQLSDVSLIGNAGLVKMGLLSGLFTSFSLLSTKPTCTAAVSVVLHGLNLRNHTGSGLKYGNRVSVRRLR